MNIIDRIINSIPFDSECEPVPKYILYFALGMVGFVIGHAVTKGVLQ